MLNSLHTLPFNNLNGREFKSNFENANGVLLDVRTPEEFAAGHIQGSVNIDIFNPDFRDQIDALDKSKEYFVLQGQSLREACMLMAKFKSNNLMGGIGAI
jgi:hypothetical protein